MRRVTRGARRRLWTSTPFRARCLLYGAGDVGKPSVRGADSQALIVFAWERELSRMRVAHFFYGSNLYVERELSLHTQGRRTRRCPVDPGPGAIPMCGGADHRVESFLKGWVEPSRPARGRRNRLPDVRPELGAIPTCAGPA